MYLHFGKRIFDLLFVLALAPLALPLAGLVALAVRWQLGSPVLFRQTRVGGGERLFTLYKFRSLAPPPGGDPRAVSDDKRLNAFGRFLRSASLDELPQFWNILRGDMSVVGPRPLLDIYIPRYSPRERLRHSIPQGITGWSQVNGRNAVSWGERFEQDLWYVDHRGLILDLQIVLLTVYRVFSRSGISKPGVATNEEFQGTIS